ncbi:MAG TPA: cobalamin-independent methionine synthase II family protein [Gaiella sp.]|jgi:5-methyltetrahydropteroyltriglutamate--homocysteine methyltransferase
MFTATAARVMPTTVTGSWPRPTWYTAGLWGRPVSDALLDISYREEFLDAVDVVIGEQERAGLDIVTNGDYHLDPDLAGLSWMRYPLERIEGLDVRQTVPAIEVQEQPPGTLLAEVTGAWRVPAVAGRIGSGARLEFDKLWRIAQSRSERPVKFGTVSSQLVASMLDLRTDAYADDKRELMWDLASAMNAELRRLVAAGCKVVQIEEPLFHFVAATSRDRQYLDFLIDCFNHEISGLDEAEVWVHTCWGNANMQRVLERTSYAEMIETYMDRVAGDVWTVEMKDRAFADLELFQSYRSRMRKKIAVGIVSHRTLQVESPEEVAGDIRYALNHIDPEHLVLSSDCGFGRQGSNRLVAFYKSAAIVQGTNIVRRELGLEEEPVRAADPLLQIDAPTPRRM